LPRFTLFSILLGSRAAIPGHNESVVLWTLPVLLAFTRPRR
jgi:hypothetical protein